MVKSMYFFQGCLASSCPKGNMAHLHLLNVGNADEIQIIIIQRFYTAVTLVPPRLFLKKSASFLNGMSSTRS